MRPAHTAHADDLHGPGRCGRAHPAPAGDLATDRPAGKLETVATFDGPMPTGVTVSHSGRIFVCFPKWGDKVDFTVAEVRNGGPVPYPDAAFNRAEEGHTADRLVSVQSVVVDPSDRLWIVDTGSIMFGPTGCRRPEAGRRRPEDGQGRPDDRPSRPTWPCPRAT